MISRRPLVLAAIVLLVALLAPSLPTGSLLFLPHQAPAPHVDTPLSAASTPFAAPSVLSTHPAAAPSTDPARSPSAAPTAAPTPKVTQAPVGPCAPGTPESSDFQNNVTVTISLFNSLQMVPYVNTVSAYAKAVQVDIYTPAGVPIQQAVITAWAVGWNNQSLNSTLPNAPANFPMQVDSTNHEHASGQLNDFKFFPPGSTVYFNITLVQNVTDPANWTSLCPVGAYHAPWNSPPPNPQPEPTWAFHVTNGWPSGQLENDMVMTATPNIFNGIQPDPFQSVYLYLNSSKLGFPIGGPLGGARLVYSLENKTGLHTGYGLSFCGNNATFMFSCEGGLPAGIGPFYEVGDIIHFQIKAFVSTDVGYYNMIYSSWYTYVVGSGSTWCEPDSGYNFYGWTGSALPPYYNPAHQNGNFSSVQGDNPNPLTLTLQGPLTEIAVYHAVGSAPAIMPAPGLVDPSQVPVQDPGIELPAPSSALTATPTVTGAATVTFTATGLPAGATWSVLLGTTNLSAVTPKPIVFTNAPAQKLAYTVTTPLSEFGQNFVRYVAAPAAGEVDASSGSASATINFNTQVYVDIIQDPWDAGNITTTPSVYGKNAGWYDNNSQVTIYAVGYLGFPFFLILTAGHSTPNPMQYVVQSDTNNSEIPAFTGILNLSISSRNITTAIAYSYVFFNETYLGQPLNGVVLMNEENSTVFYTGDGTQLADPSDIGPFPPGVNVSFYVLAYDELGCPLRSDTYHFHTQREGIPTVNSRTYFYVVVFDSAKNQYEPNVPVNISNNSWWDICYTNAFGFCYPNATNSATPLFLAYGWYNVTVTYQGSIQSVSYDMTPASNKTLTFIFNSAAQHQQPVYSEPTQGFSNSPPYMPLPLLFGMIAAGALFIPVWLIFMEQRRKAAAEEKRITL